MKALTYIAGIILLIIFFLPLGMLYMWIKNKNKVTYEIDDGLSGFDKFGIEGLKKNKE